MRPRVFRSRPVAMVTCSTAVLSDDLPMVDSTVDMVFGITVGSTAPEMTRSAI